MDPLKRLHEQVGNPSQRTKISDPCHTVLYETQGLFYQILYRLALREISTYACTSKASYSSVQHAFLLRAPHFSWDQKIDILFEAFKANLPNAVILPTLEPEKCWQKGTTDEQTDAIQLKASEALYYTAYFRKPLLTQRLLEIGANPNSLLLVDAPLQGNLLPRPLHTAILVEDLPSVQLLLAHQAALNDDKFPTMSVLQCALGSKQAKTYFPRARLNIPMIEFLLDQGAKVTAYDIYDAAESCSLETLQRLMEHFKLFNHETATEAFAQVCEAYRGGRTFDPPAHQMLEFLLKQGAKINGSLEDRPLHSACQFESLDLVKFLVSRRADLSLLDSDSMTPLSRAVQSAVWTGNLEIVRFLLKSKADVNQQLIGGKWSKHTRTALEFTCLKYNADYNLVKLLLSYGADPCPKWCVKGESPMEIAKKNGIDKVVKIFEEHLASKNEGTL